ncbi:MAG TPA: ABC transporter ATP-binding protein [Gemmataceae bacterium]|nr:ABC transporter ATP-binding protein [Gemmataceae bacterium]
MERSAFSRAWEYVGYAPAAKWTATIAAAATGFVYVALLVVLFLFADLIISRGQFPEHSELTDSERQQFKDEWRAMVPESRLQAVRDFGATRDDTDQAILASTADRDWNTPGATSKRWKAYIGQWLQAHIGQNAADYYRDQEIGEGTEPRPGKAQLGFLSLGFRNRHHFARGALAWLARHNSWMWRPTPAGRTNIPYLTGLFALTAVLALWQLALVITSNRAATVACLEAVTRLRRLLYHHSYRLGSLVFKSTGTNEAISMFTRHVEAVHDGYFVRLASVVREPVKFVLLVALVLAIHVWLGLAFVFAALFVWLLALQLARPIFRRGRLGARRAANQLVLLQESIRMMRLAKSYLMELFNQQRVERQLSEYSKGQSWRSWSESFAVPLVTFLATIAGAALLLVSGWLVLNDDLNVAGLVVLAVALASMYLPLLNWLRQRRILARANDSAVALFDFLDRRGEVGQVVGAEFLKAISRQLEFHEVSLREPGTGRMLLDNLNLVIPAGQRVAIIGTEPAEKHALVSLIPRFLDPTSGEIRIDGKNIRWVTLDSLRNQVALVMQREMIFNDTVANNIGCGDPSFSIPQIIEAAKLVHAHNFIQKLPHGYESVIGEMGYGLKPGDQFRIALARAVLRDPSILVIEEPEDKLDEDTRQILDDVYSRILPDRTVIFLPHRLSTLELCERVVLIHKGRVEVDGEHTQLIDTHDLYRHLHYLEYNMLAEHM